MLVAGKGVSVLPLFKENWELRSQCGFSLELQDFGDFLTPRTTLWCLSPKFPSPCCDCSTYPQLTKPQECTTCSYQAPWAAGMENMVVIPKAGVGSRASDAELWRRAVWTQLREGTSKSATSCLLKACWHLWFLAFWSSNYVENWQSQETCQARKPFDKRRTFAKPRGWGIPCFSRGCLHWACLR